MSDETLEGYLMSLGKLAIMIKLLSDEQRNYIRSGILTIDEEELCETIRWHCDKLMVSMDDQVRTVGDRTAKPWDETLEDIKKQLTSEEQNGNTKRKVKGNKGKGK